MTMARADWQHAIFVVPVSTGFTSHINLILVPDSVPHRDFALIVSRVLKIPITNHLSLYPSLRRIPLYFLKLG